MVAVDFGVLSGACITGGGPTQTLTASGMVETPEFACLWVTLATSLAVAANGAQLAIGMTDGTTSKCSNATHENTGGNSNTRRRGAGTLLQIVNINTGVVLAQASFVSFSAGAITIQWDTSTFALPAAAYRIGGFLIGGSGFSARVGSSVFSGTVANTPTAVNTSPVVGESFIFIQDRSNFDNNTRAVARTVLGFASCDFSTSPSTVTQFCVSHGENSGLAAADPWMRVQPDTTAGRVAKTTNSAGDGNGFEFIGSDAVGGGRFIVRSRDTSSANEGCAWAALNFGGTGPGFPGPVKHGVFSDSMPTATGARSHPVSFLPQGVVFLPTLVSSATPATTVVSAQGGAVAIGCLNLAARFGASISTQDAVAALTRSYVEPQGIILLLDTGALGFRATLSSLTSTNIQMNYTAVSGVAGILGYLAIGQSPSGTTLHPAPYGYAAPLIVARVDRVTTLRPAGFAYTPPLINVTNVANPAISSTLLPASFAYTPPLVVVTLANNISSALLPAAFAYTPPTIGVLVNKQSALLPAAFGYTPPTILVQLQAVANVSMTLLPAAYAYGCLARGLFVEVAFPSSASGVVRFGGPEAGQAKHGGVVAGQVQFGTP